MKNFDEICRIGFQFKSNFCGKNFSSIQDVMKISMHSSAKGSVFGLHFFVKLGTFFSIAKPFYEFFWYWCVFKMELNNSLVESF